MTIQLTKKMAELTFILLALAFLLLALEGKKGYLLSLKDNYTFMRVE